MSTAHPSPAHPAQGRVVANVARGCLGNLVEWYDWFVYASFSIYFSSVFFPAHDATAQLLSAAVVFAVGFLVRPVGGWLLGIYADRFGRRAALTLSVTMMGVGSFLIGATPSFDTIGLAAPVLLIAARLLQGLSVGGEFGSSAAYLSEIATPGRRGFYSSFQYVSIILGQLAALVVLIVLQQSLSEEQMYAWGWRVPFFIGAAVSLVVLYLRRHMEETGHFHKEQQEQQAADAHGKGAAKGLGGLLRTHPKQVMTVFALTIGGTIAFYTYTTYLQKYLVNTSGFDKPTASLIAFWGLAFLMVLQPLVGHLSDRFGRRPVLGGFVVGGVLLTVPLLTLLRSTSNPWAAFGLMCVAMVFLSGHTAVAAIVKAELFPTKFRAIGIGVPHAIVAALLGGTAEPVALALKQAGVESAYFWYVTVCIALTGVAVWFIKEPSKNSPLDQVAAQSPEPVGSESTETARKSTL